MTDPASDPQSLPPTTPEPHATLAAPLGKPKQHRLTELFIGPEGLRPGWGFVLYVALVFAMVMAVRFLMNPITHRLKGTVWQFLALEMIFLTCSGLPALVMSRIEKRPFGDYGLTVRGAFGARFASGVVWGFAALSILLGMLRGAHAFYFGAVGEHGMRALKFALFWAVVFLLVGFAEEFLFRGYTLFTLSRGITFWPAAVALSLLFGGVHLGNNGESWRGALSAGLIGLFFSFTVRRTGTLWFAIGLHAAWDWAQSYFYGVADSGMLVQGHLLNPSFQGPAWLTGGSVGPEGSVLVFVVIGVLFAVFHVAHPEQKAMEARVS